MRFFHFLLWNVLYQDHTLLGGSLMTAAAHVSKSGRQLQDHDNAAHAILRTPRRHVKGACHAHKCTRRTSLRLSFIFHARVLFLLLPHTHTSEWTKACVSPPRSPPPASERRLSEPSEDRRRRKRRPPPLPLSSEGREDERQRLEERERERDG